LVVLRRRQFLGLAFAQLALGACRGATPTPKASPSPKMCLGTPGAARPVELIAWFDFPKDDPRSRELSGIAWDDATKTLWAVQDETPNIVPLVPDAKLARWSFGPTVHVEAEGKLDLEGIAITPDGFLVASEIGPRILETDRAGKARRDVALPTKFSEAIRNKSLESLSLTPDGRFLFTTTEIGLPRDSPRATTERGARVRILRVDRTTGENIEHAYASDPVAREDEDYGIADLAALSQDELFVLERGFSKGVGNRVRIYAVDLRDSQSVCGSLDSIGDLPVLPKTLIVDLGSLPVPADLPPAKQPEASPLLDNFEGLAIGPRLPDGRRALFLVSDDNGRATQFARLLVLALA
jgi:hypothetical protein